MRTKLAVDALLMWPLAGLSIAIAVHRAWLCEGNLRENFGIGSNHIVICSHHESLQYHSGFASLNFKFGYQ